MFSLQFSQYVTNQVAKRKCYQRKQCKTKIYSCQQQTLSALDRTDELQIKIETGTFNVGVILREGQLVTAPLVPYPTTILNVVSLYY